MRLNQDQKVKAVAILVVVGGMLLGKYAPEVVSTVAFIGLAVVVLVAWAMAGHAVMKSLFFVSASLSLLIFLAQEYCKLPADARTGDTALKTLVALGLGYIALDFLRNVYKEFFEHTGRIKRINAGKHPWFLLAPFSLLVGLLIWDVYQVIFPLVRDLCVYK